MTNPKKITSRARGTKTCTGLHAPDSGAAMTDQTERAANKNSRPRVKHPDALFEALGHFRHGNSLWYFYRTCDGRVLWFRAGTLCHAGAAYELVPDARHWRFQATRQAADGTATARPDWCAIGAELIRLAIKAGPYVPAPEDTPRGPGRPKKAAG